MLVVSLAVSLFSCSQSSNEITNEKLYQEFKNPGNEARPRVWWHWMNGNITKDGIKKDFEWMKRAGIGGFQNFDAAMMTPQVVENRLVYMTPEWKEAFRYTTNLADSLGLEMAIAGSPGWSESGGPWVEPKQAMKKMVWSEILIEGGKPFNGKLPHPPSTTGTFQNLGTVDNSFFSEGSNDEHPEYYADDVVVAYKVPENDFTLSELETKVTSSGGSFSLDLLTDGDLATGALLPPAPEGEKSWIQFEFKQPQTIYSVSMVGGGNVGMFGTINSSERRFLESSEDGKTFKTIIEIPPGGVNQNTLTFPGVTAKYFRIAIETPPPAGPNPYAALMGGFSMGTPEPSGTNISEIVLYTAPRINQFERKAGYAVTTNLENIFTPVVSPELTINESDIIVLTDQMQEDGTLNWTPPAGKWNVIRIGYSLTGHENSPASPEATGLEVDKLNPGHVRAYFTNYLDQYKDATGGLMGAKGLQYIITDSWEAGTANWTDNMIEEFNKRNNYDIMPWLPVLTGKIIKSSEASEKFLWDFRNTLSDMVAEYHYDELTSILKERGMGRYSESHEDQRAFIGDGMDVKRSSDIPMGATWTPGGRTMTGQLPTNKIQPRFEADVRESASVAHIYGQNIAAAESFTASGNFYGFVPENLKFTADVMLSNGLNRFVIHTSVHQPLETPPGLGLGPVGQWFTRHETWAEQAKPWMDYLARSSYMLQQGKFVADIIYIYGQGTNLTYLFRNGMPSIPEGYNYDFLNAGAVPNVLNAEDGEIATETGMDYNLLVLDESTRYMSLPVLRAILEMVEAGANVVGNKPVNTLSLNDDESEFQSIVNHLWADKHGINNIGKGKVYAGLTIEEALRDLQIQPDVIFSNTKPDSEMRFVYRSLGDQQIYWVNTTDKQGSSPKISFAIEGKEPEVWNPVTGEASKVTYSMENGRTEVSLNMDPEDALFIVFGNDTDIKSYKLPEKTETELITLTGDWTVTFQTDCGAPSEVVFSELTDWSTNSDTGIKYFSGTATYSKTIQTAEEWLSENSQIWIDLGDVKNLAEVYVNGQNLGITWKKPFKVNVTEALQQGGNTIDIKVTNLWINRIVGDLQPDVPEKYTFTPFPFFQSNSPLNPSGLLGPVKISSVLNQE